MSKPKSNRTPSFIAEFELNIDGATADTLCKRLDAARQVYNACLGEALRRLNAMKNSTTFRAALCMKHTADSKPNDERKEAFTKARKQFGFSEYDLHSYAVQFGKSWLGEHLDANTIQTIASRAYRAVNEYAMKKRGKPRFKSKGRPMKSVQGKTNKQGIRFKDNQIHWFGLTVPLIIDESDPVHQHALNSRVKYVRIVWHEIRGKKRWFAQRVCEGLPYRKPKNVVQPGVVGLDIGPSTIAIVSEDSAALERFANEISDKAAEIARLQRKTDRERRANNPDNYEPDQWVKNKNGNWKHKKGKNKKSTKNQRLIWKRCKRQQKNQARLRQAHRKLSAHRKSLHGKMANDILAQGSTIKTEKISYQAFQKMYGKSVGKRAPGMFVEMLRRKAANAGGAVIEFSTKTTRLSQTCHGCGTIQKKDLSERWHVCDCGVVAQRDLYSAFLATCVEYNRLDATLANNRWESRAQRTPALLQAAASRTKFVIGQVMPASVGVSLQNIAHLPAVASQNGSLVNPVENQGKVVLHEQRALFNSRTTRL